MTPHTTPDPALVFAATSTTELTLRMLVALTIILTTVWYTTKQTRRYLNNRTNTGPRITIQHQQQLTKHTNLTLLTTGTHNLLIATNQHNTTLLAQGPHLTATQTLDEAATQTLDKRAVTVTQTPDKRAVAVTQTPDKTATPDTRTTPNIDIRTTRNPLKTLQNKTVRR